MRKIASLLSVLMLLCTLAFGQARTVTGVVRDEKGDPIPFATIVETGTRNATQADANGNFTLKISGNRISVSASGHQEQTLTVTGNTVNAVLATQNAQLSEVVVTTALGVQRQAKELGYSTSKITSKELVQARPLQVQNGLTGKVSGLQINTVNNGVFAPTRIVLRGNRSLTGNNQPLVVVDGSIYYGDLSTLNPDDISDITILKGASASAIYGSDASNGVIVVTTKKGIRGKPSITFSTTTQLETVAYMLKLQNRFGSNGGEKFVNDFTDLSTYIPYENQSYGPEFNGAMVPLGRPVEGGGVLMVPYRPVANQKKDFFDLGITEQNNITYQAGDENSRFFISAQDVSTKGVMPKDVGHRDVFRIGGSKTYGIFSAQYSLAYTYKHTDVTNTGTVYQMVMNTPYHVPLSQLKDWQTNKYASLNGYYNDYFDNPYWVIDNNRNKTSENTLAGNIQLNLKPTSWLNLTYRLSINNINSQYDFIGGVKTYSTYAQTSDTVLYSKPSGNGVDTVHESPKYNSSFPANASYNTNTFNNFLLTSDFLASVDKNITNDFNIKATAGATYINNRINYMNVNAGTLTLPVYNIANRTGLPGLGQFNDTARKFGLFGELTLGFKSMAYVHGSYRGDIDSRLSKSNRFIPYYDVDASLIISELIPSMKDSKVMNFVKIRAAHSVTGNASALAGGSQYIAYGAYATVPTFYTPGGFPFNGLPGYLLNTTIANPDIKPETVTENEVGLELGFWQNRVSLIMAAYQSELTNGIVYAQIPRSSGFTSALVNAAHTQNKGFEAELKLDVVRAKDLTWNIGVNWTHNQNKVLSINGGQQSLAVGGNNGNAFAVVGQSYPVIETRDWVRDPAGHVIVDPLSGNPKQDPNLKILGQATPADIVGITSSLNWKRFTLSATADYRGGYKIFNSIGQYIDFTGISYMTASTGRQRFVFPNSVYQDGSGKYVTNTNVTVDDANFNFWPGLWRSIGANYVTSAAAWKLREVAITYEIPRSVFAATKVISRASFTLSGRNLLMFRPKTNQWTDPEFNEDTGNDVGRTSENQLPPTRIISGTLSITF